MGAERVHKLADHVCRIGGWNMRTLVEADGGDPCTSRRGGGRSDRLAVERKAELMVIELVKCGVSIAGISETRWFGCNE